MKHLHLIALSAALSIAGISATAQVNLSKVTEQLRSSQTNGITYAETRDPKTKQLEDQKTIITTSDKKARQSILDAIEKDRKDAIKYHVTDNQVFNLRFENKNIYYKYTIVIKPDKIVLIEKISSDKSTIKSNNQVIVHNRQ